MMMYNNIQSSSNGIKKYSTEKFNTYDTVGCESELIVAYIYYLVVHSWTHYVWSWTFKIGRGPSSRSVRKVAVIKSKFSPHVTTFEHERDSTDICNSVVTWYSS